MEKNKFFKKLNSSTNFWFTLGILIGCFVFLFDIVLLYLFGFLDKYLIDDYTFNQNNTRQVALADMPVVPNDAIEPSNSSSLFINTGTNYNSVLYKRIVNAYIYPSNISLISGSSLSFAFNFTTSFPNTSIFNQTSLGLQSSNFVDGKIRLLLYFYNPNRVSFNNVSLIYSGNNSLNVNTSSVRNVAGFNTTYQFDRSTCNADFFSIDAEFDITGLTSSYIIGFALSNLYGSGFSASNIYLYDAECSFLYDNGTNVYDYINYPIRLNQNNAIFDAISGGSTELLIQNAYNSGLLQGYDVGYEVGYGEGYDVGLEENLMTSNQAYQLGYYAGLNQFKSELQETKTLLDFYAEFYYDSYPNVIVNESFIEDKIYYASSQSYDGEFTIDTYFDLGDSLENNFYLELTATLYLDTLSRVNLYFCPNMPMGNYGVSLIKYITFDSDLGLLEKNTALNDFLKLDNFNTSNRQFVCFQFIFENALVYDFNILAFTSGTLMRYDSFVTLLNNYQHDMEAIYDNEIRYDSASYIAGVENGTQRGYEFGFSEGLIEGSGGINFGEFFFSIIDAPIQAVLNLFNFDIFGYNMRSFFLAVFSICLVVVVIRLILRMRF